MQSHPNSYVPFFFTSASPTAPATPRLFCAGQSALLRRACVAVVGTRSPSPLGRARARRLSRELVAAGAVVMSGLAAGIDTEAHVSAIAAGGHTVAVIGTPLDRTYPAASAGLQQIISREHLLVSPFPTGSSVTRANFPRRNKVMATLSQATVIIEAAEQSGTLHQAAECLRLGRPLFIARSLVTNPRLSWPQRLLQSGARILTSTQDVLSVIGLQSTAS